MLSRWRLAQGSARLLIVLTAALLAVRLYAAHRVGFGDSEALYACYALHPQPAYLDHPGLVGVFARAIATHGAPTPLAAHVATAMISSLVPWLVVVAARGAGASWRSAFVAACAVAVVPEIAIGLFAMTPDLLLAIAWLAALGLGCAGLRATPASARASALLIGAGLAAGIATAAKVSGVTLVVALAATYATRSARAHARTAWPWLGLLAGALVVAPIALFEARTGWSMSRHRLVDTQGDAGPSLRNVAAVVGGQLAYLSPLVAIAAAIVLRDLVRSRGRIGDEPDDAAGTLLLFALALPLVVLVPLCLWSRVAEPHWIAPALLALPIHYARRTTSTPLVSRRFGIASLATSLAIVAAAHAWILVPSLVRFTPASFDASRDITSELYGWPEAIAAVRRIAVEARAPGSDRGDLVVVGPHWVICAQLEAGLATTPSAPPVGCATPIRDDFDRWYPRATWQRAETIVLVTDGRFAVDAATLAPKHVESRQERVTIWRAGRVARIFVVRVLERRAAT